MQTSDFFLTVGAVIVGVVVVLMGMSILQPASGAVAAGRMTLSGATQGAVISSHVQSHLFDPSAPNDAISNMWFHLTVRKFDAKGVQGLERVRLNSGTVKPFFSDKLSQLPASFKTPGTTMKMSMVIWVRPDGSVDDETVAQSRKVTFTTSDGRSITI